MNKLQIFKNAEFGEVRVVEHEGQPCFVASDVAKALGYEKPNNAVNEHCKKVNKFSYPNSGQLQPYNIIPESDVYRLVMRSNLPKAIEFQDWICEEVIPSLRKTGGYMLTKADDTPESIMARAVLVAQETIERLKSHTEKLESRVEEMRPKELFADSVSASESSILVGQLAALLKQNGVNIGQNRLFERLRNDGFLIKFGERRNCPTQRALDMGLFELKERTVNNPDGTVRITLTTKVTGKGQVYFVNRYIGEARKASILIAC
jgi:anti-repressor protein